MSEAIARIRAELVVANRILAREGVVDAFGHVSVRHPERPDRYFLARSLAPELVTEDDILEFDFDGECADRRGRAVYAERHIHGCIYAARAEVGAVCHNHAPTLIPFGATATPLRPILHVAGTIGAQVPIWDIGDEFGDTDLLVTDTKKGSSLARALGPGRAILMRGHGATVAAHDLRATVFVAVYLMVNAGLVRDALALSRSPTYLSPGEAAAAAKTNFTPLAQDRAWAYWARRAGVERDG